MNPPQPPAASSSTRPNNDDDDDVTWLNFLRTAGGTVSEGRSDSGERKRRHAGSSPERRGYPHPNHAAARTGRRSPGMSVTNTSTGNSRDTAIDLTASSPDQQTMRRGSNGARRAATVGRSGVLQSIRDESTERRGSDGVPPRWQADAEVHMCPVCRTDFSFWYRKHHCRKCGRVVCATCSPHRITIPRHYIVQPPGAAEVEAELNGLLPSTDSAAARNPALGGGDVVRVCNPCVPDPWTPAAPTDAAATAAARPVPDDPRRRDSQRSDRYRYFPPTSARARAQSHQPAPNYSTSLPGHAHAHPSTSFPHSRRPNLPPPTTRPPSHRHSQSSSSAAPTHTPSGLPLYTPRPPAVTAPSAPPHPRPRRQIREEDECPVCGTELPPGDERREAHVQECIAARFAGSGSGSASTPPTRAHPHPAGPPSPTASTSTSFPGPSASTPPTTSGGPGARPRAPSYRPRGMALYRATEKDCLGADGAAQECVICFEEFAEGDEMGRMECLCKFHRWCIRRWWEAKGVGSCPTHQLSDE